MSNRPFTYHDQKRQGFKQLRMCQSCFKGTTEPRYFLGFNGESVVCDACVTAKGLPASYTQLDRNDVENLRTRQAKEKAKAAEQERAADTEDTKRCGSCVLVKPLRDFHVSKRRSKGRASVCKACKKEIDAAGWAKPDTRAKKKATKHRKAPIEVTA